MVEYLVPFQSVQALLSPRCSLNTKANKDAMVINRTLYPNFSHIARKGVFLRKKPSMLQNKIAIIVIIAAIAGNMIGAAISPIPGLSS